MWLFLSMLCFATGDSALRFEKTEIFATLNRGEVAVTESGEVYLMDFEERRILHYDRLGKKVNVFGSKGMGPGEIDFPENIYYSGGKVYVVDLGRNNISIFQADGTFIEAVRLPTMGATIVKAAGGWAYANFRGLGRTGGPVEVNLADHEFKEPRVLMQWERESDGGSIRVERAGSGVPKIPYNPASDRGFLVGNGGRFIYVSRPGKLRITVIDGVEGKIAHVIERDDQPVPFNEDWGKLQLKQFKENRGPAGFAVEFTPEFPENFPLVRAMFISGEGQLVVEKWTGRPDETRDFLVLDEKGQEVALPYSSEFAPRVLAVRNGEAYLDGYDAETEQAVILKCAIGDIDAVAKANPIKAPPNPPRFLMRTGN